VNNRRGITKTARTYGHSAGRADAQMLRFTRTGYRAGLLLSYQRPEGLTRVRAGLAGRPRVKSTNFNNGLSAEKNQRHKLLA